MNWLPFALLVPLLTPIANFADKYLVTKVVNSYAMPVYAAIISFIVGSVLFILTGFPLLPLPEVALIFIASMLPVFGGVLYYKGMTKEHASNVIFLSQLSPVVILIFSVFLLKETLLTRQASGFLLILGTCIIISLEEDPIVGKLRLSKSFFEMLLVTVAWSTGTALIAFAVHENAYVKVIVFQSFGRGLGGLLLFLFYPPVRKAFLASFRNISVFNTGIIIFDEIVYMVALCILFFAFLIGPAGLVSVINNIDIFVAIFYGAVLTKTFPHLFKENSTRKGLLQKGLLGIALLLEFIY